jgi:hypothetical protein
VDQVYVAQGGGHWPDLLIKVTTFGVLLKYRRFFDQLNKYQLLSKCFTSELKPEAECSSETLIIQQKTTRPTTDKITLCFILFVFIFI